ncbi:MAG TPA: cysteine synthase A [Thermohalobaculum sp.]|nr:cysteine synthase A [Thermohalobaculum sp.]
MAAKIGFGSVKLDKPGRGRIYNSIVETIGNTPLVRIPHLSAKEGANADLCLKLEFFNPIASVKDRIGVAMILDLEDRGEISPGWTLIEPTSGNTGIGLAFAGAARGYKVVLTMPDSMSIERRKMLAFLGAELHLTPRAEGIKGAIAKAEELLATIPNSIMPSQFTNPANPEIHRRTTAEEIWTDTGGEVDAIVCGIGTGGTFTGCASVLKPRRPGLKMVAVEPELSPVLSGGEHSPHVIQGIGAGFIPDVMDTDLIDEIVQVSNDNAVQTARAAGMGDGIPIGISGGAITWAALQIARRPEMRGKRVVAVIPGFAERYVSTVLFEGLCGE